MRNTENPEQPEQRDATYCLRHPGTESNLRCGRCGDLICPRCMVTSPVGGRCPTCARLGRPAIMDTSSSEMGRAILFGMGAGVAGALALSVVLRVLVSLPSVRLLELVIVGGGMAAIGYLVGESVRYGSGKKIDRRLKYVAAGGVFTGWVATAIFLPLLFSVGSEFITGPAGIAGLIIAFYVATYRVRI
ncbi:MAG: hypothetical protein O3B04_06850 [Chloroflexi bacterium]|nr:hypothetical protein [Chloroflexota bacterium]